MPAEPLLGQRARGCDVQRREQCGQHEMTFRLFAGKLTAGALRCRPMTSAMSRNGTPSSPTAYSRLPVGQPPAPAGTNEPRPVGARRPSGWIQRRHRPTGLWPGDADQGRDEGIIALAVHRRRRAHHPDADPAVGERQRQRFRNTGIHRKIGHGVLFGRQPPWRMHQPGAHHEELDPARLHRPAPSLQCPQTQPSPPAAFSKISASLSVAAASNVISGNAGNGRQLQPCRAEMPMGRD
jgi:hypothetical protein